MTMSTPDVRKFVKRNDDVDKDEVQSQSESSPLKQPSHQEPTIEENFMEFDSSINNPSNPIIKNKAQPEMAQYGEEELLNMDVLAVIIP